METNDRLKDRKRWKQMNNGELGRMNGAARRVRREGGGGGGGGGGQLIKSNDEL